MNICLHLTLWNTVAPFFGGMIGSFLIDVWRWLRRRPR